MTDGRVFVLPLIVQTALSSVGVHCVVPELVDQVPGRCEEAVVVPPARKPSDRSESQTNQAV